MKYFINADKTVIIGLDKDADQIYEFSALTNLSEPVRVDDMDDAENDHRTRLVVHKNKITKSKDKSPKVDGRGSKSKLSEAKRNMIVMLLKKGKLSVSEIVEKTGVSNPTIYKIRAEEGLTPQPRGTRPDPDSMTDEEEEGSDMVAAKNLDEDDSAPDVDSDD